MYTFLKVNLNTLWIMKFFKILLLSFCLLISISFSTQASFIEDFWGGAWAPSVRYCTGNECGIDQGADLIRDSLWDIETDRSISQYVQDVVAYLLSFLALIAVIYVIYAGFNIMIWNGDEEKLKKSRQTIIYVLLWLIVIFLAWPITLFILNILNVT